MPLRIGETFAGYRILRLLGSGGMGEVYLVQHPRLPREDALKVLRPDISTDSSFRERFIREADLAAGLRHPHIVGLQDRGEQDGQMWIAMDYIDGTDAAQLVRDRFPAGMPIELATTIVTAVASALDYAHKKGLLHRDVKPANIIVADIDTDEPQVFLADFGVARPMDDTTGITTTNMTVGTVAYAAPEQLMGEQIDGRADQYALAATTYHLLTGLQLFPHSNPAVVISRHLNTRPPTPSQVRPDLAALDVVLRAALAKDPADRFTTCSDFACALTEQALGTPQMAVAPTAQSPRPSTSVSVRPSAKRSRTHWAMSVGVVVAILAIVAAILLMARPWQRSDTAELLHPPTTPVVSTPPSASAEAAPSRATTSLAAATLPAYPPTNSGCQGTVTAHQDINHPTLGPVRIFLILKSEYGTGSRGCIAAITAAGAVLPAIPLDVLETFGFANPATDSTGNTFINYNPGRYDGVLVLIPNAGGFEDIGWANASGTHFMGRHAYYYAELVGPGPNGQYTIRQSHNDCTPDCATGTTTTQDLRWDGTDYVA